MSQNSEDFRAPIVTGNNHAPLVQASETRTVSHDARTMMAYDSNKKSTGVAYLLWFFLAPFGAHRFYLRKTASGFFLLILWVLGFFTFFATWILVALWWFVDAFLIPGMVERHNGRLAQALGAGDLIVRL